ncbi:MAG: tRNA 2-thiouridine(34) synthase MnmA [Deltaproteobacteria bacterium]|nr:tRNA 2-thiouridine(34) synthase MnmA [Deltaproteobacteria bacterium]
MIKKREPVVVAMSGGVVSSVTAGLLLEEGHPVIGATLLFRPYVDDESVNWCCGAGALEAARSVSKTLGIAHHALDCAAEFEEQVLRPAWNEYDRGRTPSPCIACNERIKFGILIELAKKLGATKVASGHYARIDRSDDGKSTRLLRGVDRRKDQSYFLFSLTSKQLDSILFPLGDLQKSEVRRLARKMGFSNADRPDSQDACFVYKDEGFAEGLRRRFDAEARPGRVLDSNGTDLGKHPGIHRFTIGQRKGLGIALGHRAYVSRIDATRAEVVLSSDESFLMTDFLTASEISWKDGERPALPMRVQVKIRYRHEAAEAMLDEENGRATVRFDEPQRAVTPGQAAVFYDGECVVGGGWIE